ncbi:MAG TPA: hypothetical protein VF074_20645 [Pyrinomonadaceae bacterium]
MTAMNRFAVWSVLLLLALFTPLDRNIHQSQTLPIRRIDGQTLSSSNVPKVTLKFDKAFKYVGTQSFVLYDVANAEQHFFVDADKDKRVKRFYWIQFEGYLPTNTHTYNYQSNKVVKIGNLDFFADAYARNIKATPSRAGSDGSRAQEFLKGKGFTIGDEIIMQRLVHLTDATKRNELMIIYMEDLSQMGMTAAELTPGGGRASSWQEISNALLERAIKSMKVSN